MEFKFRNASILLLAIVFAVASFAGSAFAWQNGGAYYDDAEGMIFSYYDIRTKAQGGPGLTDNYFTIVNEDSDGYNQAHIRVRTGQCSVELLDFDILLTGNDVFTFDLYQGENGATVFASCDTHTLTASQFNVDANGCFILDTTTFPAMLSLIQTCGNCPDGSSITAESALEATRWGYIEFIPEVELDAADFDDGTPGVDWDADATECTKAQLEAGVYNAWTFIDAVENGSGDCNSFANWFEVSSDFYGRVYYARLDASANLMQLGTGNAYDFGYETCGGDNGAPGFSGGGWQDNCSWMVIHRPCYSDTSPGCSSGDGELENSNPYVVGQARYAYDQARTSVSSSQGATDMNYCFWNSTITSTGDVQNRVGAGATYGPTMVDINWDGGGSRSGSASIAEQIVNDGDNENDEGELISHYFSIPGLGQTRFALTFPFQHFINQTIEIVKSERYDTEENECVLPTSKFISPGLPAPGQVAGEVTIFNAHDSSDGCNFNEGWLELELDVASDGLSRDNINTGESTAGGSPGVAPLVVHWGDDNASGDVFAVSPMHED